MYEAAWPLSAQDPSLIERRVRLICEPSSLIDVVGKDVMFMPLAYCHIRFEHFESVRICWENWSKGWISLSKVSMIGEHCLTSVIQKLLVVNEYVQPQNFGAMNNYWPNEGSVQRASSINEHSKTWPLCENYLENGSINFKTGVYKLAVNINF